MFPGKRIAKYHCVTKRKQGDEESSQKTIRGIKIQTSYAKYKVKDDTNIATIIHSQPYVSFSIPYYTAKLSIPIIKRSCMEDQTLAPVMDY